MGLDKEEKLFQVPQRRRVEGVSSFHFRRRLKDYKSLLEFLDNAPEGKMGERTCLFG